MLSGIAERYVPGIPKQGSPASLLFYAVLSMFSVPNVSLPLSGTSLRGRDRVACAVVAAIFGNCRFRIRDLLKFADGGEGNFRTFPENFILRTGSYFKTIAFFDYFFYF